MIQTIQTQEKKAREAAVDAMKKRLGLTAAVYADRDYDQLMGTAVPLPYTTEGRGFVVSSLGAC